MLILQTIITYTVWGLLWSLCMSKDSDAFALFTTHFAWFEILCVQWHCVCIFIHEATYLVTGCLASHVVCIVSELSWSHSQLVLTRFIFVINIFSINFVLQAM
jgi:hypothetical protein